MSKKLSGKVAVVTGASKGIGAAIAKQLAEDGASVVVNYSSSQSDADKVVAEIEKSGGKAVAVQANVGEPDQVKKLISETIKAFQTIDILINNAGVYEFIPLENITPENFYKMFDINVLGLILVTQEAVKHFNKKGGAIVNIGSVASTLGRAESSVYSATKASVDIITRALSKELGPKGIRINAINPGMVLTEGVHSKGIDESDFRDEVEKATPLGRIGIPKDIATAVSFIVSEDASWITGETLFISGGFR